MHYGATWCQKIGKRNRSTKISPCRPLNFIDSALPVETVSPKGSLETISRTLGRDFASWLSAAPSGEFKLGVDVGVRRTGGRTSSLPFTRCGQRLTKYMQYIYYNIGQWKSSTSVLFHQSIVNPNSIRHMVMFFAAVWIANIRNHPKLLIIY